MHLLAIIIVVDHRGHRPGIDHDHDDRPRVPRGKGAVAPFPPLLTVPASLEQ